MKFSHSLQFNCVPEWTEHYLNYGSLKRALYALERALYEDRKMSPRGTTSVPSQRFESLDADFHAAFTAELERVLDFYVHKEEQGRAEYAKDALADDDVKSLYVTLNDVVFFYELNREGFLKIAQKYGKYINSGRGDSLKAKVDSDMALDQVNDLKDMIGKMEGEKSALALPSLLRERVIFERSTVWQDMVEMERKTSGLEVVQQSAATAAPTTTVPDIEKSAPVKAGEAQHHAAPASGMSASAKAKKILLPVFCGALFAALMLSPIFEQAHMNRALAVVVFTIALWCTEALPLYATAMLVPLMVAVCDVFPPGYIARPLHTFRPADVAKFIFGKMFSETIMLLLGGFSLASALSKYGIAKILATNILGRVGRNPGVILMVVMAITTIASFVMSNVAAPVLTFSLIQPLLRALGVDHPLAKSLVVGVAYAANIGGFISPISSPQNLFAMKDLGEKALGWGSWLAGSLPMAVVTTLSTWAVLRVVYRTSAPIPDVLRVKTASEPFNSKQIFVIIVSALSIALWMTADMTKKYLGGLGVLALFPLVALFGTSILSKDDFNGFLWNVVMLAMGGSAVGVVVSESGLLRVISIVISEKVGNLSLWVVTAIFSGLMLFVATFVSHSVSSIIMTPVVVNVANELMAKNPGMPKSTPQLMVIVVTFVCSIGMGMPISGFPNITAMSLEDGAGRSYIGAIDFLKTGLIASVFALIACLTIAYGIFYAVL